MLVLSRRVGERIRVGSDIEVSIVEIQGNRVRLGFSAPDDVRILREEIMDKPVVSLPGEADFSPARGGDLVVIT